MSMIKTNSSIVLILIVVGWVLFPKSSMAEPEPVFAKDPGKIVDYSRAEGVSMHLSKVRKDYYQINISAPNTDSADCYCPVWVAKPISNLPLFAISLDEPGQCEDTILISSQICGLKIYSGDSLAKWIQIASEAFKNISGTPNPNRFYIKGARISLPDSNDIAHSYLWGEFPIYELSGILDTLDVTFALKQDCAIGSLKAKTKLFRIRGLTLRLVIDQRKGFPVITKVP